MGASDNATGMASSGALQKVVGAVVGVSVSPTIVGALVGDVGSSVGAWVGAQPVRSWAVNSRETGSITPQDEIAKERSP